MLTTKIKEVINKYIKQYRGITVDDEFFNKLLQLEITTFDGGIFIARDDELDIFVEEERRGKWKIRSICEDYLRKKHEEYDILYAHVFADNHASLRLVTHFGFIEESRNGDMIKLRKVKDGRNY